MQLPYVRGRMGDEGRARGGGLAQSLSEQLDLRAVLALVAVVGVDHKVVERVLPPYHESVPGCRHFSAGIRATRSIVFACLALYSARTCTGVSFLRLPTSVTLKASLPNRSR